MDPPDPGAVIAAYEEWMRTPRKKVSRKKDQARKKLATKKGGATKKKGTRKAPHAAKKKVHQ